MEAFQDPKQESYEGGDYQNLMFERLSSDRIQEQIVDLLYDSETYHQTDETNGESEVEYKSRLRAELEARIAKMEEQTEIDHDRDLPVMVSLPKEERVIVTPGFDLDGQKLSIAQMDMAVAHEKGHVVRVYQSEILDQLFQTGFDISSAFVYAKDIEANKQRMALFKPDVTDEEAKEDFLAYLFSAQEIAERMSQLKNWLRLRSEDMFTKEHLRKVKQEYLSSGALDNHMGTFLSAVTPDTEDQFIEIVNNGGI